MKASSLFPALAALLFLGGGDALAKPKMEPTPVVKTQLKKLRRLAKQTTPGQFYPQVRVPADLTAFRRAMLAIGNQGRRDPDYRKKAGTKVSKDLSGATTLTEFGPQKVNKNRPNPPYFLDLKLNARLNDLCQFQAEYVASTKRLSHDGPANYNGHDMRKLGTRAAHFKVGAPVQEGLAAGPSPDLEPTGWMQSDTHYRPWFNIDHEVRQMGLGAAQADDGTWYFCKGGATWSGTPIPGGTSSAKKKKPKKPGLRPVKAKVDVSPLKGRKIGPKKKATGKKGPLEGRYVIAKPENGWHKGRIKRVDGKLEWHNDAGVKWGLTPKGGNVLDTDNRNPYRKDTPHFVVKRKNGKVTGFTFGIHFFIRQ